MGSAGGGGGSPGRESFPHLDVGTRAVVAALGERLRPGVVTWMDLFTADVVVESRFETDLRALPIRGHDAVTIMCRHLRDLLVIEQMDVREVIDGADGRTVVYTADSIMWRPDLQVRAHQHYVCLIELRDGRISRFCPYGGPLHRLDEEPDQA